MKRIWLIVVIVAAVFTLANMAQANSIVLSDPGSRYPSSGPFTARVAETIPDGLVGDPVIGAPLYITFTTFCIEQNEIVEFGYTYFYTIASYAANGGAGGQDPVGSNQDPLDQRSAYLYYNFRSNPGAYDAKALQAAFWFIENEETLISNSDTSVRTSAQTYVNDAFNAVNNGWTNDGSVVVLNLWRYLDGVVVQRQSQFALIETPTVPEPATMLLLGLGLVGVAVIGRKLKR